MCLVLRHYLIFDNLISYKQMGLKKIYCVRTNVLISMADDMYYSDQTAADSCETKHHVLIIHMMMTHHLGSAWLRTCKGDLNTLQVIYIATT